MIPSLPPSSPPSLPSLPLRKSLRNVLSQLCLGFPRLLVDLGLSRRSIPRTSMVLITHRGEEIPEETTKLVAVNEMEIGGWRGRKGGREGKACRFPVLKQMRRSITTDFSSPCFCPPAPPKKQNSKAPCRHTAAWPSTASPTPAPPPPPPPPPPPRLPSVSPSSSARKSPEPPL